MYLENERFLAMMADRPVEWRDDGKKAILCGASGPDGSFDGAMAGRITRAMTIPAGTAVL